MTTQSTRAQQHNRTPWHLTEREFQLLRLYSNGFDGPAAARHLRISIATINSHNKHIFAKLDATNKAHAVAIALREGLIE